MSDVPHISGIKIIEVRIRNFRCLQEVDLDLDWITVLLGENDSGKTSFLEALFAAIGGGRQVISATDVFIGPNEKKVPRDRVITIDVLMRPTDEDGEIIDIFESGSYWVELFGEGISQDGDERDFVAIRTQIKWNEIKSEYEKERRFLIDWKASKDWDQSKTKGVLLSGQIEPLALNLLDAKRDMKDELQNRSSFWSKLVSDLDLDDKKVEQLEKVLSGINKDLIDSSEVLGHVQNELDDLYETLGGNKGSVSLTPLPRNLRDLNRGIDVNYATAGAQSFSLSQHGMGTRSLAAVLIFRAYTKWRIRNAKGGKVHPMLALEEPESHLHPQAQRALFSQIDKMPGQRIVSTHSPYIVSQANISHCRLFRKDGSNSKVSRMSITSLEEEDIRKINRHVLNTRGDLLFARAILLFEGETEEQAFPIFAENYWEHQSNALGIALIGVGGDGKYLPFLKLASSFRIPWYIFSDGEAQSIKKVQSALRSIGIEDHPASPNVFIIPGGLNFESYLVDNDYGSAIISMLDSYHHIENFLDTKYIPDMDGREKKKGILRNYSSAEGRKQAMIDILSENKARYAKPLAEKIINLDEEQQRCPELIRTLFDRMSDDLGLNKGGR
jgi:putative ATP-dependent endonuclease of OLD family